MTSAKYSSNKLARMHDLKYAYRGMIVPSVIALFVFMFEFVIRTYSTISHFYMIAESTIDGVATNISGAKDALSVALIDEFQSLNIRLELLCIGALFAIFAFIPFMKKRNVNFYMASPVSRKDLFANRVIAAVTLMTGILVLTIGIDTIINCYYLKTDAFVISMALSMLLEAIAYSLTAFSITGIGMCSASNILEGIIFGGGIGALPSIVLIVIDDLCCNFLEGYARRDVIVDVLRGGYYDMTFQSGMLSSYSIINPLFFSRLPGSMGFSEDILYRCYCEADAYGKLITDKLSIGYYLPNLLWIAISVAFIFVARNLFIKRKAENTGMLSRNKGIAAFVTAEIAILGALVLSNLLFVLGKAFFAIILVVGFSLAFFLLYSIATRKIKHSKKFAISVASICVVIIGAVGILSSGGFGYSTYVPDAEDIECVTYTGIGIGTNMSPASNKVMVNNIPTDALGIFDGEDEIKLCTEINKKLVKNDDEIKSDIRVVYKLKNGKKICRAYSKVNEDAMKDIFSLTDTKSYRDALRYYLVGGENDPILDKIEKHKLNIDAADFYYYSDNGLVSDMGMVFESFVLNDLNGKVTKYNDGQGVKKALLADFDNMSYKDLFFNDEAPVAFIGLDDHDSDMEIVDFTDDASDYIESMSYYERCNVRYAVYPSMTNTINYLKSIGAYDDIAGERVLDFDSVYYQKLNEYGDYVYALGDLIPVGASDEYGEGYSASNYDPEYAFPDSVKSTDKDFINECYDAKSAFGYFSADDYLVVFKRNIDDDSCKTVQFVIPASRMEKILNK